MKQDPETGEWDGFGGVIDDAGWRQSKLGRLRKLFKGCGWSKVSDLDAVKAAEWLDRQVRTDKMSVQTRGHYAVTAKHFGRWLTAPGRVQSNPFKLDSKDAKQILQARKPRDCEKRIIRRYLSEDELKLLRKAAEDAPRHPNGPTGKDRSMAYLVSASKRW